MTYWPNIVNWILPSSSSSSSSSSEFYDENDEEFETNNQTPNDDNEDVVSSDQLLDIDSVVSPNDDDEDYDPPSKRRHSERNDTTTRVVSQKKVWTQQDEVELLHGFLDYTSKRRQMSRNTNQQRDQVSSFFDNHVGAELKLRYSKSQIVDKLRRSKRKYRNATAKNSQFRFKNSHDKAMFEICREIWKNNNNNNNNGGNNKTTRRLLSTVVAESNNNVTPKTRSQTRAGLLKKNISTTSIDDDRESSSDTMELIMDLGLNNYPILELIKFGDLDNNNGDEKRKKEKIIEMEVYLNKLELVQEKVKAALYNLRSKLD